MTLPQPLTALLTKLGERQTPVRAAVYDYLARRKSPVSVDQLFSALGRRWNLVTVYRTLDFFVRSGLVDAVRLGERQLRYEWRRDHHHHARCTVCGRIVDVSLTNCPIEKFDSAARQKGFRIDRYHLELTGRCHRHRQSARVGYAS